MRSNHPIMKNLFILFTLFLLADSQAQRKANALKITYTKSSNGTVIENQDRTIVFTDKNRTFLSSEKIIHGQSTFPYEIFSLDRTNNKWFQTGQLSEEQIISTVDSTSISNQKFIFSTETKKILGYLCKKATTNINSNTIDIWYTEVFGLKGAPSILGQDLGVVLETVRNGNYSVLATDLQVLKNIPATIVKIPDPKKITDLLTYRDELWKSRFTTITVFENEVINFSDASKSNDSVLRFANGTVLVRKLKVGKINSGSKVFVDLKEQSNGDAYDRTGSVFVIPLNTQTTFFDALQNGIDVLPFYENGNGKKYQGVVRTDSFTPLVELMRFFTPFGVGHFNYLKLKDKIWEDAVFYRQDISDLAPILSKQEVIIGVFIGNYDQGGHKVNLNLTIHNEDNSEEKTQKIIPLFNTLNVMEMAGQEYGTMFNSKKGLEVEFNLSNDLVNAKLRYITTGHGGWENGDEYLPKKNSIFLDDLLAFGFTPWKTDCGSYRNYNPASGNFENGLSSSDYSRSNWCPGTTTNPVYIELGTLKAGQHSITIKIPQGENEGTSFSAWNVSGLLIGE